MVPYVLINQRDCFSACMTAHKIYAMSSNWTEGNNIIDDDSGGVFRDGASASLFAFLFKQVCCLYNTSDGFLSS